MANIYKYDGTVIDVGGGSSSHAIATPWKDIAHRGLTTSAPQNSLPALYEAAMDDCEGVEFDVRETSDGYLVLSHDPTISGTVNGVSTTYTVASTPLATLRNLVLANSVIYGTIKVPTLEEALKLCAYYNLEPALDCKIATAEFVTKVAQTVVKCGMGGKCMYNTNQSTIALAQTIIGIDLQAKFHFAYNAGLTPTTYDALTQNKEQIIITLAVANVTSEATNEIHLSNYPYYIWNVTASNYMDAFNANPNYVEYTTGTDVSTIEDSYLSSLSLYTTA